MTWWTGAAVQYRSTGVLEVVGPALRVPGSDQFMFVVGLIWLVVGLVALVAALVVRTVRRRRDPEHRRRPPVVVGITVVVALLGAGVAVANRPLPFEAPEFPALPRLFPDSAFFYRPITDLPVRADSAATTGALRGPDGSPLQFRAGFGGVPYNNIVFGVPFNIVTDSTPREKVHVTDPANSSLGGPVPITNPAYIESFPGYGYDNHYVGIDVDAGRMWELISTRRWFGHWSALSGVQWDLSDLRFPKGTSTGSGLPLFPGTVTYDQVASGTVDHAIIAAGPTNSPRFVWPARFSDGTSTDPAAPPMGTWFRLRADAPVADLPPQARVLATALQRHGMVLSDTAATFSLRGTPDRRWDVGQLAALERFTAADFEVVDASGVMVAPDSMEAKPPSAGSPTG
ncbi:MAG: hypothetical protein ACOYOP_01885 [Microthrixaceae bacterium]